MNKKKIISVVGGGIIFLLILVPLFFQRRSQGGSPITATAFKLNTIITLTIYDSDDESLLSDSFALCDSYEKLFSRTLESSELYRLNHGTLPQEDGAYILSDDTSELIAAGLEYGRLSDGSFDITIGPISSLWDFTSGEKTVPSQQDIDAALPLVNYQNVSLDGSHIRFSQDGMELDLGAIAKGYIADRIKEFLVSKGVESAIINLGGNVLCVGSQPDGSPFEIGIQKPFADRSTTIAVIEADRKSVVSSGVYERYFEKDGVLYHHLLNPATGYPYDNGLLSVTIISDQSVDGDGLSTSCFALGLEKGMELINSLPDVQAVFITDDYELHLSDGFADEVNITFTDTD